MEGDSATVLGTLRAIEISIHSLRMEGDKSKIDDWLEHFISIHSLRMEGDRSVPPNVRKEQ